jgi:hypothetical protein
MSKSPLSGAFAGSSEPAKKNKKNGALLLISGIALATSIGGVFAANSSIEINGGAALEFGQGLADVSACAAAATTTMTQVFDPTGDTNTGEFYVDDVVLTVTGCDGVMATISVVHDDSGDVTVTSATATAIPVGGVLTVDFATENIVAANVTDITVTTAD